MDRTDKQADTLPEKGQSSTATIQGTSEKTPETYTKEQVEKLVSDSLAKAGRDAKSLTVKESALKDAEKAIEAERQRIAKWQADREKEELEAVKDDPEALTLFQRKKALREADAKLAEERAAFEEEKATYAERLTAAEETDREILIFEIAGEKIEPDKLKGLCDKINARTREEIQAVVDAIAGEIKPGLIIKPDSGATIGGGEQTEEQRLKTRYPSMYPK